MADQDPSATTTIIYVGDDTLDAQGPVRIKGEVPQGYLPLLELNALPMRRMPEGWGVIPEDKKLGVVREQETV